MDFENQAPDSGMEKKKTPELERGETESQESIHRNFVKIWTELPNLSK